MWRVVLLAAGGCSFSAAVPGASDDAGDTFGSDAAVAPDAPLGACDVRPSGAPMAGGAVGPGGGSTRPDVACGDGEVPIGFDFRWKQDDAVIAVHVRCGALARAADGTITTTPRGRAGDDGLHGTCIITSPINDVSEQTCPPGQVLTKISINNISTSYNSFAMTCQPVTSTLVVAGTPSVVTFAGTGMESDDVETASCPEGTAILSFGLKSGCDQELLDVRCTSLACN